MKLRRKPSRLDRVEAFDAHRREQVRQLGEVAEDLQTTVRALKTQLEHLQRTVPGKCGSCGKITDSPDMLYCHEDCRRSWVEKQLREGKTA